MMSDKTDEIIAPQAEAPATPPAPPKPEESLQEGQGHEKQGQEGQGQEIDDAGQPRYQPHPENQQHPAAPDNAPASEPASEPAPESGPAGRGTGSRPDELAELPSFEIARHDSAQINQALEALASGKAVLR